MFNTTTQLSVNKTSYFFQPIFLFFCVVSFSRQQKPKKSSIVAQARPEGRDAFAVIQIGGTEAFDQFFFLHKTNPAEYPERGEENEGNRVGVAIEQCQTNDDAQHARVNGMPHDAVDI